MRVTEIRYTKRFNLGNYQHEELGMIVSIDEDEEVKADEVFRMCRKTTEKSFKEKKEQSND